jgi:Concanavalin A-like lectin/glucanases superfamily/VanZ like family
VLAWCLLACAVALVLAATLLPSEPEGELRWSRVLCVVCGQASLADGFANLVLFVPLGLSLALLSCGRTREIPLAAALSLSVELAQFVVPGRDPNLGDFIFNTLGAVVGGEIVRSAPLWMSAGPRAAARLSLAASVATVTVFILTAMLLTVSLPDTAYVAGSRSLQGSTTPLRIGGNVDPHSHFQGRIDEVRVYRRARTPDQIRFDMAEPLSGAARSADLVAAYDFDEGAGSLLADVSGHGNTGQIVGATWIDQGRFGRALAFDGIRDMVVIPHSRWLDLTDAMTLEAWVHPTASQTGWRAIIQKEFDIYFLAGSSGAGARRPGGGGTFATSTESVIAPGAIPTHAWTHLALTYDGAALRFYVNGTASARRLRWYPGRVLEASLGEFLIPEGPIDARVLRAGFAAGLSLRVRAVAVGAIAGYVPLLIVRDKFRREILSLGADSNDLVLRIRTRASTVDLDSPAIRARGVLRGVSPGENLVVTVSREAHGYCVVVNGRSTCGQGFTLGLGWGLFGYSQIPGGWMEVALGWAWMAGLMFPVGFWIRHRWESALAVTIVVAGVVLPTVLGTLAWSPAEIVAALVGMGSGAAAARRWQRSSEAPGSD